MNMDIKETPKTFEIVVDLPGVNKHDINVHIHGDALIIEAERNTIKNGEKEHLRRFERFSGRVSRTIHLPKNIIENRIQAETANGVLYITVPKSDNGESASQDTKIEVM